MVPSLRDGGQSEHLLGSHQGPAEEQAERRGDGPAVREERPLPPQSPQSCSAWAWAPLSQTQPRIPWAYTEQVWVFPAQGQLKSGRTPSPQGSYPVSPPPA